MKIKNQYVIQPLLDEYIAIENGNKSQDSQNVISLNETGKDIFLLLQDGLDKPAIVEAMMKDYEGVTAEVLGQEVDSVVDLLRAEGVLADD